MGKVLVTGFEPFDGDRKNSSLEVIHQLCREKIDGVCLITKQLPCVFGEALADLLQAVDLVQPMAVICLGQLKGAATIKIERVALNLIDARIPDNKGNQPIDVPVIEQGPVAHWSTLPVKAITNELQQHGIPAKVSQSAGTYVCNAVFYGLMHWLTTQKRSIKAGFIHLPALPEQVIGTGHPSMHLDLLVKAMRIVIRTVLALKHQQRERESG